MAEEIKLDEIKTEVTDETKEEVVTTENDESGKDKEKEDKGKEKEVGDDESIDETKLEPEVRTKAEIKKEESEEEDETDPEDKARIEKIVEKKVGGKMVEIENKMEVQSFVAAKPEYAKYQNVILKYMNHPAYANIPVYNIAAIVASKDAQKIGAAKEREAQRVVAETKSPGGTVRKTTGETTDWLNAPKAEYEAQKAKVLGHP